MSGLDWFMVAMYLVALLGLALWASRKQSSGDDYYLAGRDLPAWTLATSTIATQCSTNSLLGAPAFVGFVAGGGMVWLQYELAVPLSMLALAYLLLPIRRSGHVSIYGFLEDRLGREARLLASGCFLLFRGVATGVTVYGIAIVLELLLDISYGAAVCLLMIATITYDFFGGLRAVVISDVVQMLLIVAAICTGLALLLLDAGDASALALDRAAAIRLDLGLTGQTDYGFWPMLVGGFFLYCAYYGCDQSQAQRVLAARSEKATGNVLLINGLLRFPLVLLYCLLGLALASFAARHPGFLETLPTNDNGLPNVNMVFPVYVLQHFPAGLVGLVMVGIFAAAMSSIDSALNSLSAASIEDFVPPKHRPSADAAKLTLARVVTVIWGVFAILFSFQVENIAPTVLESINKIGSFANGPLLALFTIALVIPGIGQKWAICAFLGGLLTNALVSYFLPGVSWLWWNLIGFVAAVSIVGIVQLCSDRMAVARFSAEPIATQLRAWLLGAFGLILAVCVGLDLISTG